MPLSELERTLVDGCLSGDEAAWSVLYRSYAPDLARYLRGMGISQSEADDLVQRVLIEFLRSLERFRGDASLRTWLHRIAHNVALQSIRGSHRRQRHLRSYAETAPLSAPGPQGRLEARQQLERVQALLDDLDQCFREVWLLREVQHLTVAECAEVLDIPPATVRTRHHRARRRLLDLLDGAPPPLRLVSSEGDAS